MEGTEADRERLVELLREHSLILGEVTLASGATASYYVDARRTVMGPEGSLTCGRLIADRATALGAGAVGGRSPPRFHWPVPRSGRPGAQTCGGSSSAVPARSVAPIITIIGRLFMSLPPDLVYWIVAAARWLVLLLAFLCSAIILIPLSKLRAS